MGDDQDLKVLAAAGRKIEAIRLYRERHSVGLKEAKDVVDSWVGAAPPRATAASAGALPPQALQGRPDSAYVGEITRLVVANQKIQAIKLYREWKLVGLKEAKDAIDTWPTTPEAVVAIYGTDQRRAPSAAPQAPAEEPLSPPPAAYASVPASPSTGGTTAAPCEGHIDDRNLGQAIDLALRMGKREEAIQIFQERYSVSRGEAERVIDARTATSDTGAQARSGCFIATAAYGSIDAPEVEALRRFRDRVLLRSGAGRRLVDGYYRVSPPIAARLAQSDRARSLVRGLLRPVAALCEVWR
jgi:ribosomal protein L7/L12